MKKYNIIETNAKGTTVKVKFQTNDKAKADRILDDFQTEYPDTEYHILKIDD